MKLKDCLITDWICGLETVGESVDNILLHMGNLFVYEDYGKEETELLMEFEESKLADTAKIKSVLMFKYDVSTDDLDAELEKELRKGDLNEVEE